MPTRSSRLLASRHAGGFGNSSKLTSPVLILEYQEQEFGGEKECVLGMKMFTVQMLALKPSGAKTFGGVLGASSEALELGGLCAEILFSRRPP